MLTISGYHFQRIMFSILCILSGSFFLQCSDAFPDDALMLLLVQEAVNNEPQHLFISSSTHQGNMGSVAAADSICQNDSAKPGAGLIYKALISDGNTRVACISSNCVTSGAAENADWVLKGNRPYYRVESGVSSYLGRTNAAGIFLLSENALQTGFHSDGLREWWTGLDNDWKSNANDCTDWTVTGGSGITGTGNQTGTAAINDLAPLCLSNRYLICVAQ